MATRTIHSIFILFIYVFISLAADCWCLFMDIVVYQLWSSAFSHKRERAVAGVGAGMVRHGFGMVPPPLGVGALRKRRTLCIGSGGTEGGLHLIIWVKIKMYTQ